MCLTPKLMVVLEHYGSFRRQSLTRVSGFLRFYSLALLPPHSLLSDLRYSVTSYQASQYHIFSAMMD